MGLITNTNYLTNIEGNVAITFIKNLIDPFGPKETKVLPAGQTVRYYIEQFLPEGIPENYTLAISKNTKIIKDIDLDEVVQEKTNLVFAVMPEAEGSAAYAAVWWVIGMLYTAASYAAVAMPYIMAAMAIYMMYVAYNMDSPNADALAASSDRAATVYGWESTQNYDQEGMAWPVLYGTTRISPPRLAKYINNTDTNKQYLNLLYGICDHPATSLTQIEVNNNPLVNYPDAVTTTSRLGTLNQEVVPGFEEVIIECSVNQKLSTTYITRTTTGNVVECLGVGFVFPRGLFAYQKTTGARVATTVYFQFQYRLHADSQSEESDPDNFYAKTIESYGPSDPGLIRLKVTSHHYVTGDSVTVSGTSMDDNGTSCSLDGNYTITVIDNDHFDLDGTGDYIYTLPEGSKVTNWSLMKRDPDDPYHPWTAWEYVTINDCSSSSLIKYYRLATNLTPGTYDVRARLSVPQSTDDMIMSDLYWEVLKEITFDTFNYPGATVLGVQALATESLNGSLPKVTVLANRATVPVWDPTLAVPAYVNKPANNPAWASYDLIHNDNYGAGVSYDDIIYADFKDWADFCTENGYTVNIYLDTVQNLRTVLNQISTLGRGHVIQKGKKYSVIVDRPFESPVQGFLFNNTNIKEDSFVETWMPITDRFNVVEITYEDEDANYTKQTFQIYADDFETTQQTINIKSIELKGCTNRSMAIAYGKRLLNINRYITLSMTFNVDIDAIGFEPGQIIEIAHDRPSWGQNGRVLSATTHQVVLDHSVEMYQNKTYFVLVRHLLDDSREYFEVLGVNKYTTTNTLTLADSATWKLTPSQFDLWAFGEEDHVTKLARVSQITRTEDQRRQIKCIEYNPLVYDDTATVGVIESPSTWVGVTALRADEVCDIDPYGKTYSKVNLSWRGVALKWNIYYKSSTQTDWIYYKTVTVPYCDIIGLQAGETYDFAVSETDSPVPTATQTSGAKSVQIEFTGLPFVEPDDPTDLTAMLIGTDIKLTWDFGGSLIPVTYNLYENAVLVAENLTVLEYLYKGPLTAKSYIFTVETKDAFKQTSDTDSVTFTIPVPSSPSVSHATNGETCHLYWQNCLNPSNGLPIDHYIVHSSSGTSNTTEQTYSEKVSWSGSKTYSVTAVDVAGNVSATTTHEVTLPSTGAVTGIVAIGKVYSVQLCLEYLTWAGLEGTADFQAVEIWAGTTNNRTNATKVGETTGSTFTHFGLALGTTYYYWTHIRDIEKNYGAWYPLSATGGRSGTPSSTASDYLAVMSIDESSLSAALRRRIDWIDTTAFVFGDDYCSPSTTMGMNGVFSTMAALLTAHDTSIASASQQIDETNALIVSAASALEVYGTTAPTYNPLSTYYIGDRVKHAVDNRWYLYECNDDQAVTGTWNPAKWDLVNGLASSLSYARAWIDGLNCTSGDLLSRLETYDTGLTQIAAIENKMEILDANDSPIWSNVTVYHVGDIVQYVADKKRLYKCIVQTTAGINPTNAGYWTEITAGLMSQWTLKMDTNGYVAGVGLALDGTSGKSAFTILADQFKIMNPDLSGTPQTVFVVGQIAGVTGVGINGNLIVDGTISGNHINAASEITLGEGGKLVIGNDDIILDGSTNRLIISGDGGELASDSVVLSNGEIQFRYFDEEEGEPLIYKSLRRIEIGTAESDAVTVIPGYFKSQPTIFLTIQSLQIYNANAGNQNQQVLLEAYDIKLVPGCTRRWQFVPRIALSYASNIVTERLSDDHHSGAYNTSLQTDTIILPENVNRLSVTASVYEYYMNSVETPSGYARDDHYGLDVIIALHYRTNNQWLTVQTTVSAATNKTVTLVANSNYDIEQFYVSNIGTGSGILLYSVPYFGPAKTPWGASWINLDSYTLNLSGDTVIASGTVTYIAIE